MNGSKSYLFGRVGRFGLLIPAVLISHVSLADEMKPDVFDLRGLFGLEASGGGAQASLSAGGERGCTIIFDRIGKLHTIADSEFLALPAQFNYAGGMFDAICRREIEGLNGLRLRHDPQFRSMPGPSQKYSDAASLAHGT
jgi:hypothetical protein